MNTDQEIAKLAEEIDKFHKQWNVWENEVYPRIWHKAYYIGYLAKQHGLPRECNLSGAPFCHNENILKVYKSAWEQGYDNKTDGISRLDLMK